ncbi:MAG: beta-propeller domain-containing protein [Patescibacteria group bacterium]
MKKNYLFIIVALFFLFLVVNFTFAAVCSPKELKIGSFGQRSKNTSNIQACLIKAGYVIKGGATGYYGNETSKVVKEFYASWYGKETGKKIGNQGVKFLQKFLSQKISGSFAFKRFSSQSEFKDYLIQGQNKISYMGVFSRGGEFGITGLSSSVDKMVFMEAGSVLAPTSASAERVSETNAQVKGIDEPDIIKTDGQNIFYSSEGYFPILRGSSGAEIMPSKYQYGNTTIVSAFPIDKLGLSGKIDKNGNLLLLKDKKILVVFANQEIVGYDVSNPANPEKKWILKLESDTSIVTSRLYENKIYLITKNYINDGKLCPISPLSLNGAPIEIKCVGIYHPVDIMSVDVTFTAMLVDAVSGNIEKNVSFVGSQNDSVVYMSSQSLYIAYPYQVETLKLLNQFFEAKGKGLISSEILSRLIKLQAYDISEVAKMTELEYLIQKYKSSLKVDDRLKFETDLNNSFLAYYDDKKREFERTGIVKIDLSNFDISNTGNIPGRPLNQFALDEYKNNLRIAITVGDKGSGVWWLGGSTRDKSANDVYVLNKDLSIDGSAQDLGLTERIYSARFVGDRGYLVTFRQTDPFYILDLSNPQNPILKGELKIPGYSAYLEPIGKDRILGIGQESSQIKASLFDVSSAEKPIELDRYLLKDGWSEVLNNHRAFLRDDKHQIFFLPTGSGGYVISYKNDKIELLKAVSGYSVKRAIYLDDYLYVLSSDKIIVFDENSWEKVKELDLVK